MVTFLVVVHVLAAVVSFSARARFTGRLRAAATANGAIAMACALGGAAYVASSLWAAWSAYAEAAPDAKVDALVAALVGRLGGIAVLLGAGLLTTGAAVALYVRSWRPGASGPPPAA